jgi:hypothetical protein
MTTNASYAVTGVHYRTQPRHIERVEIRPIQAYGGLGHPVIHQRETVVNAIDTGTKVITAIWKNGQWMKGDDVIVVAINFRKYLRTDGNRVEEDNLGELPAV